MKRGRINHIRRHPGDSIGSAHTFRSLAPVDLRPSHGKPTWNAIGNGVNGGAPDPLAFKKYMAARSRIGYIPTLLKDWVTAHAGYRAAALAQVRDWVEENSHLFKH